MKVMVVGGGAREHALCAKLARSREVSALYCAPGNGGTAAIAENVALDVENIDAIVRAARERAIDFVVIGPEGPLCAGVIDALSEAGILAFGPRKAEAQLEGSKAFSKRFMERHRVPTATAAIFDDPELAAAHVRRVQQPFVVKADGLAAGKGVIVAASVDETLAAIDRLMRAREFGASGERVLLEQRLFGEEVSYHVVIDGERFVPLCAAQDHKRLLDGDRGPNTGGMGAYSPPPVVTPEVERKILERIVTPTLRGLRAEGFSYRGALFIGLMIADGEPYVIEYNTRFGDPETEVILARYDGDILPLLLGAARGDLRGVKVGWDAKAALAVVIAAPGYPGAITKGAAIAGLEAAGDVAGVSILHAGTRLDAGHLLCSGGRVLAVTAHGDDIDAVAARAYEAVDKIRFEGMQFRRDIGHRARGQRHA